MIAAAGSGERLGAGGPKAFVEVCGRPLLAWSIEALASSSCVSALVVAAPEGAEAEAERVARSAEPGIPLTVVSGGATRSQSVALAMAAVAGELLLIHDAARPLLGPDLADRVLRRLLADPRADAAIAATPLRDTVKQADGSREVSRTLDREGLWAAQTPQAFRVAALRMAQQRALESGELEGATDEALLIEAAGGRVLLEEAPASNLKVTTREDLAIATALLERAAPA